jgi:hypothetical protein
MGRERLLNTLVLGTVTLLIATRAFGQTEEQSGYCEYVMHQAMAQRDVLRAPEAVGGISQPTTGTPPQLYWGISHSLSNYGRAKLIMDGARKDCESHRATAEAAVELKYALPRLEADALGHRAILLGDAIEQLDAMVTRSARVVDVHNLTRPALYSMQAVRARLVADKIATQLKLALLEVPGTAPRPPLRHLILEKEHRESEAQESSAVASRPTSWDVKLEAGGRQALSPSVQSSLAPYGGVVVNYSLGGRHSSSHLEIAAAAYASWKKIQDGEVTQDARVLERQIIRSISVERAELTALREQEREIDSNLQLIVDLATASAIGFGNQLESDKVVLQVEIGDVTFRLLALQAYLKHNF